MFEHKHRLVEVALSKFDLVKYLVVEYPQSYNTAIEVIDNTSDKLGNVIVAAMSRVRINVSWLTFLKETFYKI